MTTVMNIFSDDATMYDHQFEIEILSTVSEEPSWFNSTLIKVNYLKPPCEVTQEDISAIGGDRSISLLATRGSTEHQVSFSEMV